MQIGGQENRREQLNLPIEIFIFLISLLSVVNYVVWLFFRDSPLAAVARPIDYLISFLLILDFLRHLYWAKGKSDYLLRRWGWVDLIGSLPFPPLQLLRLGRSGHAIRNGQDRNISDARRNVLGNLSQSALLLVLFLLLLLLESGGAIVLWSGEDGTAATSIKTGGEALWWSVVSITTVGYGDYFPVTTTGRLVGVMMMFGGITLISVLTAVISRFVLSHDRVGTQNEQDRLVREELADLRAMVEGLAESGDSRTINMDRQDRQDGR